MRSFQSARRETHDPSDFITPETAFGRRQRGKAVAVRQPDIVDAEFEVVHDDARRKPSSQNDNELRDELNADIMAAIGATFPSSVLQTVKEAISELFAATSKIPARGLLGIAVFLSISLTLGVYFYGPMGPSVAYRGPNGLTILDLHQSPVDSNGLRIIELTGTVENGSSVAASLPPVLAELRTDSGLVAKTAVSLGDAPLQAGKSAHFSIRIPYPGGKNPQVAVSFATKGV